MKIKTAEEICDEIEKEIGYKTDWKKRVKRLRNKKYVLWSDVKDKLKTGVNHGEMEKENP